MRVGVIRGDMPGPVFLADLEPTSQTQFPIEPAGQTRYLSRPDPTLVGRALAQNAPASITTTADTSLPVTINNGNKTLRFRLAASGSYTVAVLPTATYSTLASLVTAANAVLVPLGVKLAVSPINAARLVLETVAMGAGTYLQIDTTGNGSTFNTPVHFASGGANKTVPSASALISATLPVGGPLDVSLPTLRSALGPGLTDAQCAGVADSIAPQFVETDVALKSFEVGVLHQLLSSSFNPDPHRVPAITPGAAITVVQDDGVSLFVSPTPTLSGTTLNSPHTGDVTLSGSGLANPEQDLTYVKFVVPSTGKVITLSQAQIRMTNTGGTQGSVTDTSIVVPASLIHGVGTGSTVQVRYTSLASNVRTI